MRETDGKVRFVVTRDVPRIGNDGALKKGEVIELNCSRNGRPLERRFRDLVRERVVELENKGEGVPKEALAADRDALASAIEGGE